MTHRIAQNALALAVIQVANYAVPLIVLLYLTKTLGVELYGVLAFSQGLAALSFVLVDLGYGLSATEKISKYRDRKAYVSKLIGGIFVVKLFLLILIAGIIVTYAFLTKKYEAHRAIFLLSILPIIGQGLTPVWFFQGVEKMRLIAIFSIITKVLFVVFVLLAIHEPADYFWVPALNGASQLGGLAIAIYLIYRLGYRVGKPSIRMTAYCLKFTKSFFISRIAVASYMSSATVILGLISQPAVVAIYSMAEQLYKAMQSAIQPVSIAAYPYMAKERNTRLMFRIIIGCVLAVAMCAAIGYFVSPALISIVFSDEWLRVIPVLNIFLMAIVVHSAAVMVGYPLAAAVDRIDVANTSVVGGSIVYACLIFIAYLLQAINPINLAIIMMLSEVYVLLHRATLLVPVAIAQQKKTLERPISI